MVLVVSFNVDALSINEPRRRSVGSEKPGRIQWDTRPPRLRGGTADMAIRHLQAIRGQNKICSKPRTIRRTSRKEPNAGTVMQPRQPGQLAVSKAPVSGRGSATGDGGWRG